MNDADYQALEDRYALPLYSKRGVTIVRGSGALLFDAQGREYVDCTAGIGVANVGHCHPRVVAAISEQAQRLITCPNVFYNDTRSRLLQTLVQTAPGILTRAFLCNSGAEAIEAALKFARLHTGRPNFVSAMRGFHGRTMGAVSATFTKKYRAPFEPLVPGFQYVALNKIEQLEAAVDEHTAAVLLEPVQGEGGVNIANAEYLVAARRLCDERGALLIFDEIQTGFCRTGKFFAHQHCNVVPDILVLAKAIAGGVPMGATLLAENITVSEGHHGTTFGGNPLACAAALAAIDIMREEKLDERAASSGAYFERRLQAEKLARVRDVRRLGLMVGIELKEKAQPVLSALLENGVLALPAGATVVRLLPPLVIEEPQLDRVVAALHTALQ
ncbi:MAG: acetylornithine/succinylornithine family transaminase [Gammaproteobacteria bacterium]|nr:acetylornithine/succinylornithine family transaminase [Gammaproteobacteria bacterium]